MPKTRQQRLAEERAGHPPSPPQSLEDQPRASKRTRAKTPSAPEVAGPVVPAAQSAASGEPQALLRIWVDVDPESSGRSVGDPTHQETIPSSLVPGLVTFLENIRNQEKDNVPESSSRPSLDQLTPSQKIVEAILPKNQTVSKPPKAKKRALRRNPLGATSTIFESQPVTASLDTSTADGISSPQVASPETPRGSKWSIGNLFQLGSIGRVLGFSPLAPVSESPESLPQTPTTITAQTLIGEPAPREPKKKQSSPTSAKDARAKHRRHNDSVIKPAKPATASKNQRDTLSRVREASPVSGGTETTGVEEEQFSDIKPTDQAQGEARQMVAEEPTPKPTIRWPSRSLDRMNQNKRKRFDEPVAIPSHDKGSYGGETDICGNNEGDGVTEEQPGKIRRTSGSREFTSRVAGDPNTPRPYEYQGTNVFAEYEAAEKATNSGMQSLTKTPIPITNSRGTFKVPSPGDGDWSDSGSEEEEGNTTGLEDKTPSRNKLPEIRRVPPLTQSEALRKAREKLLKYKPRNPSKLIQSSRAYQSPPPISEAAAKRDSGPQAAIELEPSTAVGVELTGHTNFTAFEDWCKTAPLAVTAALETMEVDSNIAGDAFARGLGDTGTSRTTRYAAFDEWSKTAPPIVTAVLENMEVDSDLAGQAFQSGLDNYTKF